MSQSIKVEAASFPPDNAGVRISEGNYDLALFRIGDKYFAVDNECPHQSASLSDGWVDDGVVACPWHCWQFEVESGRCLTFEGYDLNTYPVRIKDGVVFIDVEA